VTAPDQDDPIPHQRLLALIPKRSLVKVVFLLLLLATIVFFQRRADLLAQFMTNALAPTPPPARTNSNLGDKP
jgi:hypothetical protein